MEKIREFIRQYQWTILLVAAGIVLTILLLTIGFFKTLLLLAIVGVCFVLGYTLDKQGTTGVKDFFNKLFHKGNPS